MSSYLQPSLNWLRREKGNIFIFVCVSIFLYMCVKREKSNGCGKMLTVVESERKWMLIILFFQLFCTFKIFQNENLGGNHNILH